jgi:toxin ParE1/3/4
MPEYKIELHSSALKEAELAHAMNKILWSPIRWPRYYKETHRYFFPKFPFNIVYHLNEERIEVIAIMHHRRKPGYWAKHL